MLLPPQGRAAVACLTGARRVFRVRYGCTIFRGAASHAYWFCKIDFCPAAICLALAVSFREASSSGGLPGRIVFRGGGSLPSWPSDRLGRAPRPNVFATLAGGEN